MINERKFFGQPVKITEEHIVTFKRLQLVKEMITLPVFNYFNNYCKMIAIDLSKQQSIDADQKQYKKLILWEI